MHNDSTLIAALLGVIEGLTEFIPVSSTGHILLAGHFLGFQSTGKVFEILIQLGAILAIVLVYFAKFLDIGRRALTGDAAAWRFIIGIVIAFLPAAIMGVLAHGLIKRVLFETPALICIMLVAGGLVLLWVDRLNFTPRYSDATAYPVATCLKIGLFQVLAMVPGVSRSGATIVGALFMGANKRSAAEFSFFLALPTMFGAFVYDLYQNRNALSADDLGLIAIGFAAAFVAGLFVVRRLLDFVSSHGFTPFAWWRIGVGGAGLLGLWWLP